MSLAVRRLTACLLCCATGLAVSPVVALGEGPSSEGAPVPSGEGTGASSSLESSLVTPGSLLEGEQMHAQEEARRNSPQAVAEREASRTRFEGLNVEQAAKVVGEAFPAVIDEPAGGPPNLPIGTTITSFLTDNAAQVDLGNGERGIIESVAPMAIEGSSGQHTPVNLSPQSVGSAYEPQTPVTSVRIAKRLNEGVTLTSIGVSLTPVDAQGAPLGGSEGVVDGAAVFYGGTGTDSDTVIKPTIGGFEADTLLRAVDSPNQLYFRVGLPTGASLVQEAGSGALRIVKEGVAIATIRTPSAQDAAGTTVPLTMSVSGDTLALSVDDSSGEYKFPIEVDPEIEINDNQLVNTTGGKRSNWEFHTTSEAKFGHRAVNEGSGKEFLETSGIGEYKENEYAFWGYQTKGKSKIFEFKSETEGKNKGNKIEGFLELQAHGTGAQENKHILSTEVENPEYSRRASEPICPKNTKGEQECVPTAGGEGNSVHFQQSVVRSPESQYKFSDTMYQGIVEISEKAGTHSTTKFNTTSPEVEGEVEEGGKKVKQRRPNALYGAGGWLSKHQDALEPIAEDTGIGVAATKMDYESAPGKWEPLSEHNYLEQENGCQGVQCYEKHTEYWTVESKLPNGEDKIRYRAKEAVSGTESTETEGIATIKVDAAPPQRLFIQNLPFGNELTERPYELTVEATDGEGSTIASSGVKSVAFFVDGRERTETGKQTDCSVPKGECTASAKYIINGAELGAGHHSIEVVAVDNAGNEARHYEQVSVRHSTPVALGPGSVDLESGDFSLGATDVSLGAGLTVSRSYSSRATSEGNEGPLGPEWTLGMAHTKSLVELIDGGVLMTSSNGSQMIFAGLGEGKFESPPGDSNLTLKLEENKTTKVKEAYYLEDAANHTKVKFTLPSGGTKEWVPTVQEGAVPTDTVTYKYRTAEGQNEYSLPAASGPEGITAGPDGNLWFADYYSNKIGRITATGAVTEYSASGGPEDIAVGPDGNLWFTEWLSGKIGKITTSGRITEYTAPSAGGPEGIVAGPDGNLWYVESGTSKIAKMTTAGVIEAEYSLPKESSPRDITAGPEGNLWFTENRSNKIGKITASGIITEYSLPAGSGPTQITRGPGTENALWFVEWGSEKIGRITTSGTITEYTLHSGVKPSSIAAGPDGNLWFTVGKNIGKITPTGVVAEYQGSGQIAQNDIVAGPDGNLWFTDYSYSKIGEITTAGTITEPTEALAPVPSGVSCSWATKPTEMKPGCRALEFKYATETTAKGEGESEWGEYNRRLTKVSAVAYNPASKEMKETPVAEYRYDKLGRLRAEWDPRVSTPLKTRYGYDAEGHVTALNPPGQEPWSFTYGTGKGDAGTGRLIKATIAPITTGLWSGENVSSSEAPKITGSPIVGIRLAVSNGKWSGTPLTYGYQWEDCNSESNCTPILGANNANYMPTSSDIGRTLVAVLTATNGGGSAVVASEATATIAASSATTQAIDSGNSLNAASCIPSTTDCVVSDSRGNAYYATNVSTTSNATWNAWSGPSGQSPSQAVDCPTSSLCLLADGKESAGGKLYYATSLGGSFSEAYGPAYGVDAISCPSSSLCVDGQDGAGYFRYSTSPASTSWTLEQQGAASMKGVFCLSSSFCAIADSEGRVHVATSTSQIESSSWKETDVNGSTALNGVACTSATSCVAVDGAGNVLNLTIESSGAATASKHNIDGTNSLTAVTCTGSSTCVTVDNAGNVFVSTNGGETWTKQDQLSDKLTSVSCASSTLCVAADTTGNVTALSPTTSTGTEGELHSPGPGTTIDYNVPVSGAGAPHNMSESEVANWGQKSEEAPVEATAIFPADSPQGWPASGYTRASVYYLDELGRNVNMAQPSSAEVGDIATSEYNEYNDVVRVLTPDNRATALAAGSKSAEVANLRSTIYQYNEPQCRKETSNKEKEIAEPGTRLCETWGPQHEVKYVAGKEQKESLARNHVKYFYEDVAHGAPETEKFDLVTETSDLALLANEEEVEVRKTTTSYSGQEGLGWKLRAPTSVTTDPEGLKLTTTTEYSAETGQIKEARGLGAEATLTYASKFGESGSEPGKLKGPYGVASDSKGNLWVVDEGNSRIEEFGPEGKYISMFGKAGTEPGQLKEPKGIAIDSKGNIWVAESGNNRMQEFSPEGKSLQVVGKAGSEPGQLKEPKGIAIDSKGNIWVADTGNNRIQQFSSEGKYISMFGKAGTEPGQLKEPQGMAIDSKGNVWVADTGNSRIQQFSSEGKLLSHFGESGAGAGQFKTPVGLAFDSSGHLWVTDRGNNRVQGLSSSGAFITQFGRKGSEAGQLSEPRDIALDAQGDVWVTDTANNRLEKFSQGPNAHDSKIIYYTSQENKEGYENCGKHPEWSGLVCESLPVKQPELAVLPKLPVTTITYNMWNEPDKIEEAFSSATRTKANNYDDAGRLTSSETTATGSTSIALPKVTDEYNSKTGMLEKESATIAEKTKTVTSVRNTLGQLENYTDSEGNTAKYKYAGPEGDELLEEMSDSSNKGESNQKYTYDDTTRKLIKLVDSAGGTFTAGYDVEGKMTSEVYPNEMCANYTNSSVGEMTHVEYIKTSNCSSKVAPVWFSETRTPSVRGETMSRTSSLSSETYSYDTGGRLLETQETPANEYCKTRTYAYDEASNRISLTTREPNSKKECATEGGTVGAHNYDEASRLTDAGIEYESFGNVTKLPAADAEGHELKSTFYVNNAVATQEQNGTKNEYFLDPIGRVRETVSGAKKVVTHYDAPGGAVAWTCEKVSESCEGSSKWTRSIPGIDGALTAVQTNGATPVLQVHDLEGNIVATAALSPSETKLLSTYNSTEFGVPSGGKTPPPYAWLGAGDVASSLPSGVITFGATSYIPQTGRALQSEAVEPPGSPGGSGVGTPVNFQEEPWNMQGAGREAAEAPGLELGREREAAEAALKACETSGNCVDPPKTLYFTAKEVAIMCGVLDAESIATTPLKVIELVTMKLGDLAKKFFIDFIKEVTGLHSPVEWADSIDKDLHACLGVMTSGYKGQNLTYVRCGITTPWFDIETGLPLIGTIEIPNLKDMPSAKYCLYYAYHCGEYNEKENIFWFPSGRGLRG
jgi:streptogramin lyase